MILRFLKETDHATRLLAVFCFRWTYSQLCTSKNAQTSVRTKVVLCKHPHVFHVERRQNAVVRTLNSRLPLKNSSYTLETWSKLISNDSQHLIFRCRQFVSGLFGFFRCWKSFKMSFDQVSRAYGLFLRGKRPFKVRTTVF